MQRCGTRTKKKTQVCKILSRVQPNNASSSETVIKVVMTQSSQKHVIIQYKQPRQLLEAYAVSTPQWDRWSLNDKTFRAIPHIHMDQYYNWNSQPYPTHCTTFQSSCPFLCTTKEHSKLGCEFLFVIFGASVLECKVILIFLFSFSSARVVITVCLFFRMP